MDAVGDLVEWEPGGTKVCALCGKESGGADPPGRWIRHRPSHRRRMFIWDEGQRFVLGYFEFRGP
jgi:hypothetical protein